MDDALLWDGVADLLQARVNALVASLSEWGLELNPTKCLLYLGEIPRARASISMAPKYKHSELTLPCQ